MGRTTKEDFARHYRDYQSKPAVMKKRALNNAARNLMEKEGLVKKGDGNDVDHKKRLAHGGTNARSNLRVVKSGRNRGWKDGV